MAQKEVKYNLYYINDSNQKEYLISCKHKSVLINAILDYATSEIEGDFYRLELIYNPYSGTYLLIDIMYRSTDVIAELSPMDNILEDLIDIMQKKYGFEFKLEETE